MKQSVVLGPFCSILGLGPDFLYSDLYTECGRENQFDTLIVPIPFACSETAAFPAFSTSSTERTIQTVIMSTDLIWSQDPDPTCLTINSNVAPIAPTPAAPVDPPTKASTSRPIDLPTTASPTTSPVSRTSPNTGSGTLPTIKNQPSPPSKPQNVTQPTNTNVQVLPPTNIAPNTTLDDGARFSASYVAQFQYLRNAGCSGPNPFIVVHCLGRIKLTGRSDKRISCIPVAPGSELEFTPYTGLQCSSNCTTDSECEEIFLNTKEVLSGPPFGSIYFQCSGYFSESVSSVFHVYGVEENSTCAASSSDNSTRNIRIARMGVSCLNEAGNAFEYVFDDYYFECLAGTFNSPTFNYPSGEVACISGRNCLGEQCQFLMDDIYVLSDFRNMDDGCIASVNPITPAPVSTNAPGPGVPLEFSVVFKVVWGSLIYDEELDDDIVTSNTDDCIDGTSPVITISCPNSDITLVNATFPGTTECTSNSPGVLDCTDSGETNTNRLISVDYVSSIPIQELLTQTA